VRRTKHDGDVRRLRRHRDCLRAMRRNNAQKLSSRPVSSERSLSLLPFFFDCQSFQVARYSAAYPSGQILGRQKSQHRPVAREHRRWLCVLAALERRCDVEHLAQASLICNWRLSRNFEQNKTLDFDLVIPFSFCSRTLYVTSNNLFLFHNSASLRTRGYLCRNSTNSSSGVRPRRLVALTQIC